MQLPDALTKLVGCPTFIAMRPTGIMLCLTNQLSVLRISKNKPYKWVPMFSDLVAIDWNVFSPDQMKAMAQEARRQADEEAARRDGEQHSG